MQAELGSNFGFCFCLHLKVILDGPQVGPQRGGTCAQRIRPNATDGTGATDPWATVKARMRNVLLRTDLWSDQILVLRAVQTLTMLDL